MSRTTFIRRALAQLLAILRGERVNGLSLADLGGADKARATIAALKRQLGRRVPSLPLAPLWVA